MPIGMIFWMLMILIALFWGLNVWGPEPYRRHFFGGFGVVLFVLLFLLGWELFGFVVQHGSRHMAP